MDALAGQSGAEGGEKQVYRVLGGFIAGLVLGWLAHGRLMPAPPPVVQTPALADRSSGHVAVPSPPLPGRADVATGFDVTEEALLRQAALMTDQAAIGILERWRAEHDDTFAILIALARRQSAAGEHPAALATLEEANLMAVTPAQQATFEALLDRAVDRYEQRLLAAGNYEALDRTFESITLAMPDQAAFYLKLGLLRIRMGNYEQALPPLAQIQNHPVLGEQARGLMAQTVVEESGAAEVLALSARNNQFVVSARIDDRLAVELLIDTGAAMTILEQDLLERLGYNLGGARVARFATAGGVVEAPVVSVGRLALGGAGMGPLAVGGMNLSLPAGVDGLLGMNFLRHYEFRIDQENEALHLTPK